MFSGSATWTLPGAELAVDVQSGPMGMGPGLSQDRDAIALIMCGARRVVSNDTFANPGRGKKAKPRGITPTFGFRTLRIFIQARTFPSVPR